MKIGFIGLGKLGLPVALAVEKKGHKVLGHDTNQNVTKYLEEKKIPYKEIFADEFIKDTNLKNTSIHEIVKNSEIIFVAVQTPHDPLYEGSTKIPSSRCNFNYKYLIDACSNLFSAINNLKQEKIVVIISTVLPGTTEENILPLTNKFVKLVYNPYFIAMGNTINDFYNPEFVLVGTHKDTSAATKLKEFYSTIHKAQIYQTTIQNAELIKVAYNTFIGMKIVYANTIMEICHKIGADCDAVIDGISLANHRLISNKYLRGGMGDGGGCHPRDNIAMSWLAKKIDLSHDFFEDIMIAREDQTNWLAEICTEYNMPIFILGKSFKPETNITTGSPSILLKNILEEKGKSPQILDPYVDHDFKEKFDNIETPALFFIGTKHEYFKDLIFPNNSVVIDPFRYINKKQNTVKIIPIGKN